MISPNDRRRHTTDQETISSKAAAVGNFNNNIIDTSSASDSTPTSSASIGGEVASDRPIRGVNRASAFSIRTTEGAAKDVSDLGMDR